MTVSTAGKFRLALAAVLCACAFGATAQDYPNKTVSLVVPFSPGGSTDVQARLIAKGLTDRLGKPVIVENKAGAAGAIGTKYVAQSPADGYSLLFASISSLVTEPVLNDKAGFDPLRDFTPVSIVTDMPFLLVTECVKGAKSMKDLVAQAKAKPGALHYSSWGYGSAGNLLAEMFKLATGTDVQHVPYKGEANALTGLLGGEVEMMFVTPVNMPHIQNKKICPLAVTGTTRLQVLPDVPTFAELGVKNMEFMIWFGVVAPAKTPPEVVSRLQREVAEVTKTPEFVKAAGTMGVSVVGSSASTFSERIRSDQQNITALSKKAKIKE